MSFRWLGRCQGVQSDRRLYSGFLKHEWKCRFSSAGHWPCVIAPSGFCEFGRVFNGECAYKYSERHRGDPYYIFGILTDAHGS